MNGAGESHSKSRSRIFLRFIGSQATTSGLQCLWLGLLELLQACVLRAHGGASYIFGAFAILMTSQAPSGATYRRHSFPMTARRARRGAAGHGAGAGSTLQHGILQ